MQTVKIKEIKKLLAEGKKVQIKTPDGWVDVLNYLDKGVKTTHILNFDGGSINGVTLDHKIETTKGWKKAEELTQEDYLITIHGVKKFLNLQEYKTGKICDISVAHPNHRFYADGVSVHNCDASNTLALFKHFVDNYSDLFTEGLTLMQIDAKAIDITLTFNRRGFPADKEYMENSLKDTLRRELLLYNTYANLMTELGCEEDIYITKTEAISRHLITVYAECFTNFVKKRTGVDIDIYSDDTSLQKFLIAVQDDLGIVIKSKSLKGGDFKLTHSMDVNHLTHLTEVAESVRWLDPDKAEKIVALAEVLLNVSSVLQNSNSYYTPFLNGLTFDDSGYYKLPVALKFSGTVTTRYSNKGGKPSRLVVNRLKTKTTFGLKINTGLSGVNAQGLPSARYKLIDAKKILDIDSLGKKIASRFKATEVDVDEYFNNKLL